MEDDSIVGLRLAGGFFLILLSTLLGVIAPTFSQRPGHRRPGCPFHRVLHLESPSADILNLTGGDAHRAIPLRRSRIGQAEADQDAHFISEGDRGQID